MSRPARLLRLLDLLRRARQPQTGPALAQTLEVSLRTLYRDIASLREQGAAIEGDPGIGFEMRPGFLLPPLMFNADELEALLLGARWASLQADPQLACQVIGLRAQGEGVEQRVAHLMAPSSLRC